ncbi:MAG: DoxX family protein [Candidatus Omnitrophota bacterium]
MTDVAILVLRLCLAVVFIGHGLQASFGLFSGPGLHGFSQMLSGLGFKPSLVWAYIAACSELIGGVCLLVGFWTRLAAALLLVFIMVAAATVHLSKGFFIQQGGFEYTFVIACICLALMMLGAGKYAVK